MKTMIKTNNKPKSRITGLIIFLLALCIISLFLFYGSNLKAIASKDNGQEKQIMIPRGTSTKAIGAILKKQGLIRDSIVFDIYCKLNEKAGKFKAGKYVLSNSMSVSQIVNKMTSGDAIVDSIRFTIPEGYELRQVVDRLDAEGIADKAAFTKALKEGNYDYSFVKDIPNRENKLEGYLFPDTYEIYKNTSAEAIINKMLGRFDKLFTEKDRARARELHMTIDQVITLASIIEREAKLDSERKTVSAVFHNRISKHMRLQSCATVQYLLKEQKPVLTYKDLEIDSPYNTYKYEGLPPGPIASPGIKSIEAALYPDNVDYMYFVARNDGSHVFTRTYREHIDAQNKMKK